MTIAIVVILLVGLAVLLYLCRPDYKKAIPIINFFRTHWIISLCLLLLVGGWLFGNFLQSKEKIKMVKIGYEEDGPVLEFEIPEGIPPRVEFLDVVVVWAGNRTDSKNVIFMFDGTLTESLLGGRFATKTLGKIAPEKGKYYVHKGGIKMIIRGGSILEFNKPPYTIKVYPPRKGEAVRFGRNPIRYKIVERARP